ncbi:hypothetical protein PGTUg99_016255 [Puccinia graminis f. sp. tritici]|uniref:Uncharacterized protein n=1 Tax=Puccinia graminis f. sp. tritici TaxID=56615 RepID=A0A5B0NCC7_PUCGR|nr:hypothetical protein PGTUg99_016255 [Puccinia graminis f. sp. tritici]
MWADENPPSSSGERLTNELKRDSTGWLCSSSTPYQLESGSATSSATLGLYVHLPAKAAPRLAPPPTGGLDAGAKTSEEEQERGRRSEEEQERGRRLIIAGLLVYHRQQGSDTDETEQLKYNNTEFLNGLRQQIRLQQTDDPEDIEDEDRDHAAEIEAEFNQAPNSPSHVSHVAKTTSSTVTAQNNASKH